jgi:hypothetical protein
MVSSQFLKKFHQKLIFVIGMEQKLRFTIFHINSQLPNIVQKFMLNSQIVVAHFLHREP